MRKELMTVGELEARAEQVAARIAKKEKRELKGVKMLAAEAKDEGGAKVGYSVSGMMDEKGGCSFNVDFSAPPEFLRRSYQQGDKIPVYTNEMYSAISPLRSDTPNRVTRSGAVSRRSTTFVGSESGLEMVPEYTIP